MTSPGCSLIPQPQEISTVIGSYQTWCIFNPETSVNTWRPSEVLVCTVDADALALKHQAISTHIINVLHQFQ